MAGRAGSHAGQHELELAAPVVGHDAQGVGGHDAAEPAHERADVVDDEVLADGSGGLRAVDQRLVRRGQLGDGGPGLLERLVRHREDHALLSGVPRGDLGLLADQVGERLPGPFVLLELARARTAKSLSLIRTSSPTSTSLVGKWR